MPAHSGLSRSTLKFVSSLKETGWGIEFLPCEIWTLYLSFSLFLLTAYVAVCGFVHGGANGQAVAGKKSSRVGKCCVKSRLCGTSSCSADLCVCVCFTVLLPILTSKCRQAYRDVHDLFSSVSQQPYRYWLALARYERAGQRVTC